MKLRTFFMIMLIVFLGCGRPSASPSTIMDLPVEQRAEMITEWMVQELKLDTTAEEKAQQINLKYARLNQEIYAAQTRRWGVMKKIQANEKAKDLELKSVFTTEQYETYLGKKKELRLHIKGKLRE